MPVENPNEAPTSTTTRRRSERTEAKFFEHADMLIAEAERLAAEYEPPNAIAKLPALKAKRDESTAQRTIHQADDAAEEKARNTRENLYKSVPKDVTSLVTYAESAGKPENEIEALKSIARDIKGQRAKPVDPTDGKKQISVANLSYASIADNYARFIEQYDALKIETNEDFYKPETHRAKLENIRAANAAVIAAEAASNTSGELLDQLAYTAPDSLLNGCVSAKNYIKSKRNTNPESYDNIAKTRFELPSRLRKK